MILRVSEVEAADAAEHMWNSDQRGLTMRLKAL